MRRGLVGRREERLANVDHEGGREPDHEELGERRVVGVPRSPAHEREEDVEQACGACVAAKNFGIMGGGKLPCVYDG